MGKFTPGKWEYFPPDEIENNYMLHAEEKSYTGITLGTHLGYAVYEADARLIVAAPEMYNWIKEFLRHAGITANNGVADECRLHGDIRAVIELLARIDGDSDVEAQEPEP